MKVNNAGAKFGLNLLLNIEQDQYFGLVTKQAGLKVLIHHPQTPPMVDELGFAVAPGTSTFVAVQKRIVRKDLRFFVLKLCLHTLSNTQ